MLIARRPIAWLLVPAASLIFIYIFTYITDEQIAGNREAAISASALLLFISAPLAAVSCALEASAEKRSYGVTELATRPIYSRLLMRVLPSIVGGWIAQTCAVSILLLRSGHSYGSFLPLTILGFYAAIALHGLCGYFLGLYLPKILAIAAALIGSYGWVAFAWTIGPVQIRYMAGPAFALCCSSAGQLNIHAQEVFLFFSLLLSSAVFLSLIAAGIEKGNSQRLWARALSLVLAVIGVVGSLIIGRSTQVIAEDQITEDRVFCIDGAPDVCFTDVQLSRSDHRAIVQDTFAELHRMGMPQVRHVKPLAPGESTLLDGDTAYIVVSALADEEEVVHSAATTFSYALNISSCPSDDFEKLYIEQNILGAWLDIRATSAMDPSTGSIVRDSARYQLQAYEGATEKLDQVLAMTEEHQKEWASSAYDSLQECSSPTFPES